MDIRITKKVVVGCTVYDNRPETTDIELTHEDLYHLFAGILRCLTMPVDGNSFRMTHETKTHGKQTLIITLQ